ncbi:ABC transporter ATP-binding protein [Oceanobacillus kimchii]|uniref:ABC transporter ATP-binding protein n=1 Tax=Oceanobacillus kimchii TaxID=746691 RepID=UPI0021A46081|nr:ABC transporter ATP-binding protein [Oceanobacillus kimchii]MCT1576881.1 ABC transporter ATP-binding protein [Oceanobacillus kimchii]MCT2134951.1 ABC transporter ATP-binding protein [Oceanobacillus kimchii]
MVLHVENLSVTYRAKKAVNNVSFHLQSGEVIGILGANGAGKSSLIEAILGINPSNAEKLTVLGKSPVHQRNEVFQKVGVQFQQTNFQDKITVKEAIEQFHSLYKQTMNISTLLMVFELQDKEYQLVSSLSGGERQRLAVILALLPNPELVFLDELTTGLDTRARHLLWKQLVQLKSNGLAIVLTSHYMDEVEALCDRIIILKKGTVMFDGTITEAIQTSNKDSLEDAYLYYSGEEDIRL